MWSVIRRLQGCEYSKDPVSSTRDEELIERKQRVIMLHEMKPYPPELDPNIFTRPFGELVYEKLRLWLLADDVSWRRQAIDQLLDLYIEQRENIVRSLHYGLLDVLLTTLHQDEAEDMRGRAAEALALLLREPTALNALLAMDDSHGTLAGLLRTFDDPSAEVVIRSVRVLVACHAAYNLYESTARLVRYGLMDRCIALLRREDDERVAAAGCGPIALALFAVKEAFIPFLRAGGMADATRALGRGDALLVAEAAEVVQQAAAYRLGKKAAVECRTLAALLPHMKNENLRVRTAVTGAVAQLTIYEPGKQQAVDEAVARVLLELLKEEEERDVLVNVIKGIINVAEHPAGRRQLLGARDRLRVIAGEADDYPPLNASIAEALVQLARKC